ncbi:MAG: NDP-sugar synthase, partial [Acidobacteria bacterium]|nr:NDP-sugar synthase [Acidobacteriota bacterium]
YGGGIGLDEEGRVVSFRKGENFGEPRRRCVFAGLHVFSPRLVEDVGEGPSDFVRDLYQPMLREGVEIRALPTSRDWHDLGTPRRYLEGVLDWTRGRRPRRLLGRRSLVSQRAQVHPNARIQGSSVEAGVEVAAGALVENSLLLSGARIGEGCEVRDAIVGFGVELPAETHVQGRMINAQTAGFTAGPRDSLLGDLVYTPLDDE